MRLASALRDTRRILRLTRKPKQSEFMETVRVTSIGIIVIGLVGALIFIISRIVE
ncbi:MAG: protein translocase SEC61 complex subunit gamma [Candidatus Altiarchaeota archaeon]